MKTPIRYQDRNLRIAFALIGAYIVTSFGGDLPLLTLLLTADFYIEFAATFLITFLVIQLVYFVTVRLDRFYDWHRQPVKRVMLQAGLGVAVPTLLTFFAAAFYFYLYGINILDTNYHLYALPFIVALIAIFNIYYYIRYLLSERKMYLHELRQREQAPAAGFRAVAATVPDDPSPAEPENTFTALTPTRTLPVGQNEIAYFYRSGGQVYLRLASGQDHLLAQSLDAIAPQLDDQQFFRVARTLIAHRNAITDFQPLSYGKLRLSLQPDFREEVTVSKPLARSFKDWIAQ